MERGTQIEQEDPGPWLVRHLGTFEGAPLEVDDARELASVMRLQVVAAGSAIIASAGAPTRVYIVRSGRVELMRERAGRAVTLKVMTEGAIFGDSPMFLGREAQFEVRAVADTMVYSIESETLLRLMEQRPRLARFWMSSMAQRLAAAFERVGDLLEANLEQQVASTLLHHREADRVEMSQEMVARLVGARRTSVNQALRRLEDRGLIRTGYRYITIEDVDALEESLV